MEDNKLPAKEVLKDYMFKEIDIIQDIIKRMASNSFLIKGWAITLIVVTLLLKGNNYQSLIAFIPLIAFWILDTFFVKKEREYRMLYKWVIKNRLKTDDFLMDMDTKRLKKDKDYEDEYKVAHMLVVAFSITLIAFYGAVLLMLFAYVYYLISTGIIFF